MGPKWVRNVFFQTLSWTIWHAQARVFSALTLCGQWKLHKCLKNGLFSTQKRVKNGSKMRFCKVVLDHSGRSKQCVEPILNPLGRVFVHGKSQYAL